MRKLILVLMILACIGSVSAQNTVDVTAEIPSTLSISVTNTIPTPWVLARSSPNTLSDVISIMTSNDIESKVTASCSNGGYLSGKKGLLLDPIRSDTFYYSVGGTLTTLPIGTKTTLISLSQNTEAGDIPGTYSGVLTYMIEAV